MNASTPAPPAISRRQFLRTAVAVAGSAGLVPATVSEKQLPRSPRRGELIDTNVTLGRWPFRRLPLDETSALVAHLHRHGVKQAWASTFDGLFHEDLAAVNARLAEECRRHGRGMLLPFGSVNPKLPGWKEDLRRCNEEHKMPGLRLHPNYHSYKLDDPAFAALLSLASKRRLMIQIALSMEDERMQSPLARVPHVDAAPLLELLPRFPELRVVLLNWQRAVPGGLLPKLATAGEVYLEIATLEGVGGVANLFQQVPPTRVVFGSLAPLFYFESALLKLRESALSEDQERAIRTGNSRRLLQK